MIDAESAPPATMPDKFRIACSWCGSTNVARDAWASWDVDAQRWVLGAVFDDGFCHRCESARSLEEVRFGMLSWREAVEAAVRRQAARSGDGSFTRAGLIEEELDQIVADTDSKGATPQQTLSRELQEMRAAGLIAFVDDRGGYRWLG